MVDPQLLPSDVTLRNGQRARVRPLEPDDVEPLARFFCGLSPRTRGYYGPHPFDRETAERLCASIDMARTVRFVAVLDDGGAAPEIIGYMIVSRDLAKGDLARYAEHGPALDPATTACLAPCIADAYQEQGLGTAMARNVLDAARAMGIRDLILMGGVQTRNERGRRLYTRLGFEAVGTFDVVKNGETLGNLDMICHLQ